MTMKILVLSDSHSALSFMFRCVNAVKPDAIVHLGDHYDDGEALGEEFPHIPIYQVPGNCDRYRAPFGASEILILSGIGREELGVVIIVSNSDVLHTILIGGLVDSPHIVFS